MALIYESRYYEKTDTGWKECDMGYIDDPIRNAECLASLPWDKYGEKANNIGKVKRVQLYEYKLIEIELKLCGIVNAKRVFKVDAMF